MHLIIENEFVIPDSIYINIQNYLQMIPYCFDCKLLRSISLFTIVWLVSSSLSLAQNTTSLTQTIKGYIIDQASEEPIIGANVIVLGTDPLLGSSTDVDGFFKIENVQVGRHSLQISCIGYEDAYLNELELGSAKEMVLRLSLQESLISMDAVVVKAKRLTGAPANDMVSVSGRSFSVEQSQRYAASVNDPARLALSFAGVSTRDDEGNEIIIRGNSPRGVLWRMEGIEIPNPNHFSYEGSSGGGISALSSHILANSDFLISAFPAEYGNAASGIFDLKLRRGNNEKREYAFQAGVLGLDIAAEGPIGEKGGASYLGNYRYSTLGILSEMGFLSTDDATEKTTFQDAAFKVHLPAKKGSYTSVWGMGGLSKQTFKNQQETSTYSSDRGVIGINHRFFIKEKTYLESILSYGATEVQDVFSYQDEEDTYANSDRFINKTVRASINYNEKLNAKNTIRIGALGHRLAYDLYQWYDENEVSTTSVDEDGNTYFIQAYAQWKKRLGARLQLNTGVHSSLLTLNNQYAIEPRMGLRWNYKAGHVISLGAGLHSRLDALPLYFARIEGDNGQITQANKNLELSKSAHFVAGYEWRFNEQWRVQAEVYYQHLYDIPIGTAHTDNIYTLNQSWLNEEDGFVNDSLFNDGTGRNYGVEISVEKFFTDGWYLLATTSLYRSLYTARSGVEHNSRFDGRFVQNVLVGKEWQVGRNKKNVFGLNLRANYAGGNRETPIDLEASRAAAETVRDYNRIYEDQGPAYFRSDFRISFRKNKAKTASVFSLDIQNITNRKNVYRSYYSSSQDQIVQATQIGLIPVFNYKLEF